MGFIRRFRVKELCSKIGPVEYTAIRQEQDVITASSTSCYDTDDSTGSGRMFVKLDDMETGRIYDVVSKDVNKNKTAKERGCLKLTPKMLLFSLMV